MSDQTDKWAAELAREIWHPLYKKDRKADKIRTKHIVQKYIEKAEQSGFKRGLTFYERNQKTGETLLRADEKLERGGISQEAFDKIDFPWADHSKSRAAHASKGHTFRLDKRHVGQCEVCGRPEAAHASEQGADGLLPCPFCGSLAEFGEDGEGGDFVTCSNSMCQASSKLIYHEKTDPKPLLIEAWNNRYSQRPTPATESECICEPRHINCPVHGTLVEVSPETPSGGGEKWTPVFEENSACWYVCLGKYGEPVIEYPFDSRDAAFKIADAHNSTPQPRDCGERKLLDELCSIVGCPSDAESLLKAVRRDVQRSKDFAKPRDCREDTKLREAVQAIQRDAEIYGLRGATNHPSVKCEVRGLTLGHFYNLAAAMKSRT